MVGDVHRTLCYGGIFLYPADARRRARRERHVIRGTQGEGRDQRDVIRGGERPFGGFETEGPLCRGSRTSARAWPLSA